MPVSTWSTLRALWLILSGGPSVSLTVVCDGDEVTECSGPDQVFALMQSGRAVFAISVGAIWHRMDLELQTCDHVDLTTGQLTPGLPERPIDELTAMRLRQRLEHQHEQRQRAA